MKRILNIVSYLIILSVVYITSMNATEVLNLQLWGIRGTAETLGATEYSKTLNLGSYTFLVLLAGMFAGIGWMGQFYFAQKEKLNAYKRELEKSSITNSSSKSRVEVLEAKIATLEKALDEALKND